MAFLSHQLPLIIPHFLTIPLRMLYFNHLEVSVEVTLEVEFQELPVI